MHPLSACRLVALTACLPIAAPALGQGPRQVTATDYARAEQFIRYNTGPLLLHVASTPTWLPSGRFWYRTRTLRGIEFLLVDPPRGLRRPAFDHAAVARALSAATGAQYEAGQLLFDTFELSAEEQRIAFQVGPRRWQCDTRQPRCVELPAPNPNEVLSPDKTRSVFIRDYNLWLRDVATSTETQLTTDGIKDFGYATDNEGYRRGDRPVVLWSPDSKRLATFQHDERGVGEMYLVTTRPGHPQLDAWKYPMAGDEVIPKIHRVIIHVDAPRVVRLQMPPDVRRGSMGYGIGRGSGELADVQWSAKSSHLLFISISRDYKRARLRVADAETGAVRDILEERASTFYQSSALFSVNGCCYLEATNEVIWSSSRDNWSHLYLYDGATGKLKHQITSGEWNVAQVLRVDERRRLLYVVGVGREAGRDPYFAHLYKVGLDGKGLTLLTPENASHDVSLAPSGEYFVDSYSTPDVPPVTVLRDRHGKLLRTLETADISRLLAAGWKPPTPITVKARDGITNLYGLLFKPTQFDARRKYPLVNYIYPGPQITNVGPRTFFAPYRGGVYGDAQSLAELGFIVVQIDGMGTPDRGHAFHATYYGNMADNTLPDQVAGMRQLAQRYPWIDLERVGIYGMSGGGGAAARAMFDYPDFFKVGISEAGNHDQGSYTDSWGEKWMGLLERKPDGTSNYDRQANQSAVKKLKGRLLLMHGTMDDNVPPNLTLVLVDALIKANKDFDLLMLPNQRHLVTGTAARYLMRRRWDYFVRYLQGAEPPKEFGMREPPAGGDPPSWVDRQMNEPTSSP